MDNKIIQLPKEVDDMLDFLQAGITESVQQGLSSEAIIEAFHDYSCYWLMAMEESGTPDVRLN